VNQNSAHEQAHRRFHKRQMQQIEQQRRAQDDMWHMRRRSRRGRPESGEKSARLLLLFLLVGVAVYLYANPELWDTAWSHVRSLLHNQ